MRRRLLVGWLCLPVSLLCATEVAGQGAGPLFESGPVRPLALSADGTRLYAVNTPDQRLEIFDVVPAGLRLAGSVPVGLEPVAVAARTATEWETRFTEADVPCTRVRSVPEMLVDPQALENGALATVPHPTLGPVRLLGVPVRLAGTPGAPAGPPPALGEHTDAVLAEAGMSAPEIARLRQAGVVR